MRRFYLLACVLSTIAVWQLSADDTPTRDIHILAPTSTSSVPLLLVQKWDSEKDVIPGASISVDLFTNNAQALALLLRGDADLLFTGTSQGWENYLNGGPVVLIGTGVWGVSSLLALDPSIHSFKDLRGGSVAVPFPGSPLDVQVRAIFEALGINPDKDVHIVYSTFAQTAALLLSRKIDAAPLPEPLATNLVMNKGLHRVVRMDQAWSEATGHDPLSPQVSLFATGDHVASMGEVVGTIVSVWQQASVWVTSHPQQAADLFADKLKLPVDVVRVALTQTRFYVPSLSEDIKRVKEYYAEVQALHPTDQPTLGDSFFYQR